eukprot:4603-Heterococcus_DN1.PRE.2
MALCMRTPPSTPAAAISSCGHTSQQSEAINNSHCKLEERERLPLRCSKTTLEWQVSREF